MKDKVLNAFKKLSTINKIKFILAIVLTAAVVISETDGHNGKNRFAGKTFAFIRCR